MAINKDRFAKASQGRYFALTPAEVAVEILGRSFSVHSYHDRLPIRLENCDHVCVQGHQVASFRRMGLFALFSLPEGVPSSIGVLAAKRAVEEFSLIDNSAHLHVRDQQFVVYRALLGELGCLNIAFDIVNGVSRSYLAFEQAIQLSRAAESNRKITLMKSINLV
jgi:hypothetical protein